MKQGASYTAPQKYRLISKSDYCFNSMTVQKETGYSKIAMLLLAICPILSIYGTLLNYAIWSFLVLIGFIVVNSHKGSKVYIPMYYKIYWIYLAFDYFIITQKLGAIVPGGLSFFVFSIILLFVSRQFDFDSYRKYMRVLLVLTIVIFYAQEVMWFTTGSRFVPVLPLGHISTMKYSELVARNLAAERSASIFLEPSHFAVFLLLGLMVEFAANCQKRHFTNLAIVIILTLLFLQSGTALAGLGVILLYKFSFFLKKISKGKRILSAVLISALVIGAVALYLKTAAGAIMSERAQNEMTLDEDGHSYARIAAGTMMYFDLPTLNKIIGASDETILPIARKYAWSYADSDSNTLYMNGWATVLTHTGIIGMILLLIVLINLYRRGNGLSRSGILLFTALSFFSSTYCQPIMLITIIIATYYQHQNKTFKLSKNVK